MKAFLFYTLLVFLFLLLSYCVMGLLGTGLTQKYQVDHARIFVEMDSDKQSAERTKNEMRKIDDLEDEIHLTQLVLISIAFTTLFSIIILTLKRKIIIKTKAQ